MILVHPPIHVLSKTRLRTASGFLSHDLTLMASDLPGREGTEELLAFGEWIELREAFLQRRGQPEEHFLVFNEAIDRARRAGAVEVSQDEFERRTFQSKRSLITQPEEGPHGR